MKHLETLEEFKETIADEKLTVIDFYAQWCGPCRAMAPKYEELSEKYKDDVTCYKVDVDVATDIAQECKIRAMPTLHFYKAGNLLHHFEGANTKEIERQIKKLK